MLVLGLIMIILAVGVLLTGLATAGNMGDASLLGFHVSATTIFVVGFLSGVVLALGFWVMTWGGKRRWRQSRERKRLRKEAKHRDQREPQDHTDPQQPTEGR